MMNRVRKLSYLLVAMVFAVIMTPLVAYANPPAGPCNQDGVLLDKHDWVLFFNDEPGCTYVGYKYWQCMNCGEVWEETTPALGHSWDGGRVYQASCTEDGYRVYTCTRCGEEYWETIYATGHSWDGGRVEKEATCTEDGYRVYTCYNCGETWYETIPALGHDWDAGVTTEPVLLTDGQTVTTCRRCGETQVKVVPAAPALFMSLRDFPFDFGEKSDFRITQNPKGGYISRNSGEVFTLTVAVEGGTAPYKYIWHCDPLNPPEPSTSLNASLSGASQLLDTSYVSTVSGWYQAMVGTYEDIYGSEWLGSIQDLLANSSGSSLYDLGFDDQSSETVGGPSFDATLGDCDYWCEVIDDEGRILYSDAARVRYHLYIAEQPNNVNLQTDENPVMSCRAADGAGVLTYSYEWFDGSFNSVGTGQAFEPPAEGEYFCVVSDGQESVTSAVATVYSAQPFAFYSTTPGSKLWPEEEWQLEASCWGGVEPYEVWWDKDGVPLLTEPGEAINGHPAFYATGIGSGKYTVHATDAMGTPIEAVVYRADKHLTVAQQPKGGKIPSKGEYLELSVELADGKAPVTYDLYFNDEQIASIERNSFNSGPFRAWQGGAYHFEIVDADGHTATSEHAYVEDPVFRISSQTPEAQIQTPNGTVPVQAVAEGGKEPYEYVWLVRHGGSWYRYGPKGNSIFVRLGDYKCRVTDAEGETIYSKPVTVSYGGEAPMIVTQPRDKALTYRLDGNYEFTLYCDAISGLGEDGDLRYQWYWQDWDKLDGWERYSPESPMRGFDCGLFECDVTDRATGKTTESNLALVYPELTIVQAELYAQIAPGHGEYHLQYAGGTGSPYSIEVYLKGNDSTPDILADSNRVNGRSPRFYLPMYRELTTTENGVTKRQTVKAEYYFVVTDATGATDTSGLVTWG